MDNIEIEVMTLDDLETIKDILASDFDEFWNYNVFKEELQSENSKYLVAKLNNEIIGFAGIKIIIDEADIMNIVTKKAVRNRGVGTLLLSKIIYLCKKLNLNSYNLGIWGYEKYMNNENSNKEILPLYLKKPQAQRLLEEKMKGINNNG